MSLDLILYATPDGPLGAACGRYFERVLEIGSTTAQRYPPHCTLTGFFRRDPERVPAIAAEVEEALATVLGGGRPVVEIAGLRRVDRWIGLELRSPDLLAVAATFADRHVRAPGEDPIRLKDWLHLSLAYRVRRAGSYATLADEVVDPAAGCEWDVGLWRRDAGDRWRRLTGAVAGRAD